MTKEHFKEGTLLKVISAGSGAAYCDGYEAVVVSKDKIIREGYIDDLDGISEKIDSNAVFCIEIPETMYEDTGNRTVYRECNSIWCVNAQGINGAEYILITEEMLQKRYMEEIVEHIKSASHLFRSALHDSNKKLIQGNLKSVYDQYMDIDELLYKLEESFAESISEI